MTTKHGVRLALKTIGLSGLSGAHIEAKNPFEAFIKVSGTSSIKSTPDLLKIFRELKRQALVHITEQDSGFRIGVTPKGGLRLLQIQANEVSIPTMNPWDSKWRLVCFDIPKEKNSERLYLNRRLHELQFTMLQRSMWVHPFNCISEIRIITDYVNLTRYVSVLEVTKLDEQSARKLHKVYDPLLFAS